jgi:hypothetical protein
VLLLWDCGHPPLWQVVPPLRVAWPLSERSLSRSRVSARTATAAVFRAGGKCAVEETLRLGARMLPRRFYGPPIRHYSPSLNMMGSVSCEFTALPLLVPGFQLGIMLTTRTASSSRSFRTLRFTVTSAT